MRRGMIQGHKPATKPQMDFGTMGVKAVLLNGHQRLVIVAPKGCVFRQSRKREDGVPLACPLARAGLGPARATPPAPSATTTMRFGGALRPTTPLAPLVFRCAVSGSARRRVQSLIVFLMPNPSMPFLAMKTLMMSPKPHGDLAPPMCIEMPMAR